MQRANLGAKFFKVSCAPFSRFRSKPSMSDFIKSTRGKLFSRTKSSMLIVSTVSKFFAAEFEVFMKELAAVLPEVSNENKASVFLSEIPF